MKPFNLLVCKVILLLVILSSCGKDEPKQKVKHFILKGTVMDEVTKLPLDSVDVTLRWSTFASPFTPITKIYTDKNGSFEINYSPNLANDYNYSLHFDREDYIWTSKFIDSYIAEQDFEVYMTKMPDTK